MKSLCLAVFLLLGNISVLSQQAASAPGEQSALSTDPKLHASAVKLVELMGMRKTLIANEAAMMSKARETLLKGPPLVTEELADAWVKRMTSDESIDAYINVVVTVYEKHFSEAEIGELIQAQQDKLDQKAPVISDALKDKLAKDGVAIYSEIMGGCTQVGARLGGEIEQQLVKEHPEWVKSADAGGDTKTN